MKCREFTPKEHVLTSQEWEVLKRFFPRKETRTKLPPSCAGASSEDHVVRSRRIALPGKNQREGVFLEYALFVWSQGKELELRAVWNEGKENPLLLREDLIREATKDYKEKELLFAIVVGAELALFLTIVLWQFFTMFLSLFAVVVSVVVGLYTYHRGLRPITTYPT
ncbi:MAG: hypothetical protein Q7R54_01735 [bacterium]|nr:hypothetical protein [bacterium]